jgi:hypothetical protein
MAKPTRGLRLTKLLMARAGVSTSQSRESVLLDRMQPLREGQEGEQDLADPFYALLTRGPSNDSFEARRQV